MLLDTDSPNVLRRRIADGIAKAIKVASGGETDEAIELLRALCVTELGMELSVLGMLDAKSAVDLLGSHQRVLAYVTIVEDDINVGPVDAHVCCFSKEIGTPLSWCSAAQLECTDPSFSGVQLFFLKQPYYAGLGDGAGQMCGIAVKDGVIVAIWSRYWS